MLLSAANSVALDKPQSHKCTCRAGGIYPSSLPFLPPVAIAPPRTQINVHWGAGGGRCPPLNSVSIVCLQCLECWARCWGHSPFCFLFLRESSWPRQSSASTGGKGLQLDERDQGSMRSLVGKCFECPVRKHIKELQVPCCWGAQGSHEGWGEQAKEGPVRLAWRASWRRG